MSSQFKRTKENFTCAKCGKKVKGNGYTDHCPRCLWGRHVDITPGDRANTCGGLLEPIAAEMNRDDYTITYRCAECGALKKNRSAAEDDFEAIIKIVQKNLNRQIGGKSGS